MYPKEEATSLLWEITVGFAEMWHLSRNIRYEPQIVLLARGPWPGGAGDVVGIGGSYEKRWECKHHGVWPGNGAPLPATFACRLTKYAVEAIIRFRRDLFAMPEPLDLVLLAAGSHWEILCQKETCQIAFCQLMKIDLPNRSPNPHSCRVEQRLSNWVPELSVGVCQQKRSMVTKLSYHFPCCRTPQSL